MGFCPSGLLSQWAFVRSPENSLDPDQLASGKAVDNQILQCKQPMNYYTYRSIHPY